MLFSSFKEVVSEISIYKCIDDQFKLNGKSNLFFCDGENSNIRPTISFFNICKYNKQTVLNQFKKEKEKDEYEMISTYLVNRVIEIFTKSNQYLYFSKVAKRELKCLYKDYICNVVLLLNQKTISEEKIEQLLYVHTNNLCKFLSDTNGMEIFKDNKNKYVNTVVCEQYSPEFQLKTLGIDLTDIKQPVLDLGCGENAKL